MSKYATEIDYWKARAGTAEKELYALRLLAAEPHAIARVKESLGPLSLWSKASLDMEIENRVRERMGSEYVPQPQVPQSYLAFDGPDTFKSYCVNKGYDKKCSEWQIAYELWKKEVGRSFISPRSMDK